MCRYGSRVELSGKLTGKYDKFKVSPDHDRVQRCKGVKPGAYFLASNVYFLQFSEIMYFDCRTLTVTRRTISPTSRGQHAAALFDICETWVILRRRKKYPPKKGRQHAAVFVTLALFGICDICSVCDTLAITSVNCLTRQNQLSSAVNFIKSSLKCIKLHIIGNANCSLLPCISSSYALHRTGERHDRNVNQAVLSPS